MGFGHRVYKNYDPRARIIKKHVDEVLEVTGENPLLDIATELEKRALDDDFFTERKLYPNVDFYSGLIYEALRIPTDMFTVIFAIPRTSGWVAQWMEMMDDPEQKIARPRQIYTGRRDVDYVADRRARGPREDHRPARAPPEAAPPRRLARRSGRALDASPCATAPRSTQGQVRHRSTRRSSDARERVDAVLREGRLGDRQHAARLHARTQRVHARIEVSGTGLFARPRGRDRRDGRRRAWSPTAARSASEPLEADTLDEAFERLRAVARG